MARIISFKYVIARTEDTDDLSYVDSSSLILNGATITNSGDAANITLPAPGAPGSLNLNKDIVIDTESSSESPSESSSESASISPSISESPSNSPSISASESPSDSTSISPSESTSISPSISESPSLSAGSQGLFLKNCETNATSTNLTQALMQGCVFNSTKLDNLPAPFSANEYLKENFIYSLFDFEVNGSGPQFWNSSDFNYGIGGLGRYGIGALYFFSSVLEMEPTTPVITVSCEEQSIERIEFWDFLTTFWDFLKTNDREMFENYWAGMELAGNSLKKQASRFFESLNPENSRTCVTEDYYDLHIGPMYSKPLDLDPTSSSPNYVINPIRSLLVEPAYSNEEPVYLDMIEIQAKDYYRIRNSGLGCYVVIKSKNTNIETKFFKINNLKSSSEPIDSQCYAEMDQSINANGNDSSIGRLAITGIDSDISKYTVTINDNGATPSVATWGSDTLTIGVRTSGGSNEINKIIANQIGAPWAILKNKSGLNQDKMPIPSIATYEVGNLPNFKPMELSNGRNYPAQGKVWSWYTGYSTSNSTEGNLNHGEWVDSESKFKHMIVVDGDLSYLGTDYFTIHLTTGLAYDVDNFILSIPSLQTFITPGNSPEYLMDRDYTLRNFILEFKENIFETSDIAFDSYLYSPKAPIIESMLFEIYGELVSNPDWLNYNYNNTSAKAAINALMLSIQNSSNRYSYERALNIYYGLPVAPEKSRVEGLYESYGYKIISISENTIRLELPEGEDLHKFIQPGSRMLVEGRKELFVNVVNSRSLGTITISDASELSIGDMAHIKLNNRFVIRQIFKEEENSPSYVDIYCPEGSGAISHLIDIIQLSSDGESYPEMIIYGTDNLQNNYNGIYHITAASVVVGKSPITVRLSLYKKSGLENPKYNDYIGVDSIEDMNAGFVHIPWPTHKFLYLLMDGNKYHKAYLDAPIDTIFNDGDDINKYQTIARNVTVANKEMFPKWYQFDNFRKSNGLNYQSDILELTKTIPGAKFGEYFPSRLQTV